MGIRKRSIKRLLRKRAITPEVAERELRHLIEMEGGDWSDPDWDDDFEDARRLVINLLFAGELALQSANDEYIKISKAQERKRQADQRHRNMYLSGLGGCTDTLPIGVST